jgi:hypothetical protein
VRAAQHHETACQACVDKWETANAWYSPDGGFCRLCAPGSEVDGARTRCTPCASPTQFSPHGVACQTCAGGAAATADRSACEAPPPPPSIGQGMEYVTDDAVGVVDVVEVGGVPGHTTYRWVVALRLRGDARKHDEPDALLLTAVTTVR